jgi:hypothetical protein
MPVATLVATICIAAVFAAVPISTFVARFAPVRRVSTPSAS